MKSPKNQKSYWIYGKHAVIAAYNNNARIINRLLIAKNLFNELKLNNPHKRAHNLAVVDQREIEKILPPNAVHQGIAAEVMQLDETAIEDIKDAKLLVILDQVTDPQNVGAILRSSAAFNANAVIVPKDNAVSEGGALAKAASGALEIVPIIRITNLINSINYLKNSGFWCIGLDGEAEMEIANCPKYDKVAIILGAEGKGLRRLTRDNCDLIVRLPISEKVESLNVANAAAIALYELNRRK